MIKEIPEHIRKELPERIKSVERGEVYTIDEARAKIFPTPLKDKMNNEPLKDKDCLYVLPDSNDLHDSLKTALVYKKKSVKSAVEGFINDLTDLSRIDNIEPADVVQFEKKWFPDLCPSGDLIADKSNRQNS